MEAERTRSIACFSATLTMARLQFPFARLARNTPRDIYMEINDERKHKQVVGAGRGVGGWRH